MLVLSRKRNESIVIGEDVTVTVVELRGDKVRLGIEAPKDVRVDRSEVRQAIEREAARFRGEEGREEEVHHGGHGGHGEEEERGRGTDAR